MSKFESKEGQRVPDATFRLRVDDQWQTLTTDDLFKGKTVVVFSLPGAFTPTCSSTHLPRYNELAPLFKENGVDDIICMSVNDTFVMNAWAKDQDSSNLHMIPDGNCEFTCGMGMAVDKAELGFGERSWRYSMLVKDGVIEKMFIEPDRPGDPFEVSDAETMLRYINPDIKLPEAVALFVKPGCPYCARAKQMLTDAGMVFEEIVLGRDATVSSLRAVTGQGTAPQVFIGGRHIGGSEALEQYLKQAS